MTISLCKKCKREKLIYAKGLCSSCYINKSQKEKRLVNPIIKKRGIVSKKLSPEERIIAYLKIKKRVSLSKIGKDINIQYDALKNKIKRMSDAGKVIIITQKYEDEKGVIQYYREVVLKR